MCSSFLGRGVHYAVNMVRVLDVCRVFVIIGDSAKFVFLDTSEPNSGVGVSENFQFFSLCDDRTNFFF